MNDDASNEEDLDGDIYDGRRLGDCRLWIHEHEVPSLFVELRVRRKRSRRLLLVVYCI